MAEYAELEIGLQRRDAESYDVSLRFGEPGADAEQDLLPQGAARVSFEPQQLLSLATDPLAYGQALGQRLFAGRSGEAFSSGRGRALELNVPLRLRLSLPGDVWELHGLYWETLSDPWADAPLLGGENILFARYLSSPDWRRVQRRSKGNLRALVVIANPSGLERFGAPLDVQAEGRRAAEALGEIPSTTLAGGGSATLDNLLGGLREGPDLLYLVCHAALAEPAPDLYLHLEDQAGEGVRVLASELADRLRKLPRLPRLVVLAAPQMFLHHAEARDHDHRALALLGPHLAAAGVAAVVAMQDIVTIQTVEQFMPVFFQELQREGQVDRAIAVARAAVRERSDWWVPMLVTRLRSGQLWYTPGFSADAPGFERWQSLLTRIRQGRCTPILGPGLSEPLLGSGREIARRWAEQYQFPMVLSGRDDLPQVAQFMAAEQGSREFPKQELLNHIRNELIDRYGGRLSGDLRAMSLAELSTAVWAEIYAPNPTDPHRVLAQLPFPIYITTNQDDLLVEALKAAGKTPRVVSHPWNDYLEPPDLEEDYSPDGKQPLVYHAFGRFENLDSPVITEDDYSDWLPSFDRYRQQVPAAVSRALATTALLMVGFQEQDRSLRSLLPIIRSSPGGTRSRKFTHVVQLLEQDEGSLVQPERARRYLESSFRDQKLVGHAAYS